jgi:hypothetical protein
MGSFRKNSRPLPGRHNLRTTDYRPLATDQGRLTTVKSNIMRSAYRRVESFPIFLIEAIGKIVGTCRLGSGRKGVADGRLGNDIGNGDASYDDAVERDRYLFAWLVDLWRTVTARGRVRIDLDLAVHQLHDPVDRNATGAVFQRHLPIGLEPGLTLRSTSARLGRSPAARSA